MHDGDWVAGRSPAVATNGKVVAAGTTLLFGAYVNRKDPGRDAVAWFHAHEPIGRTRTFFVYDFRDEAERETLDDGRKPRVHPAADARRAGSE